MKKFLAAVLAIICLVALVACGAGEQTPPEPTEDVPEAVESTDVSIETPYCDLVVTKEFADNVKSKVISEDPYTVSFRMISDDTELFSISFGGETEMLLGTLQLENENVVLYADYNDLDRENENYETYCTYQEGISTIINHLSSDYDFIVNEITDWVDPSTFDIQTPVVTMKYPNRWKEKVTIDVSEEAVKFSCNGEKLFDIVFSECDGFILGTYKDTPIYVKDYTINKGSYSEAQYLELCTMQEDMNVILQGLLEDSNFEIVYAAP